MSRRRMVGVVAVALTCVLLAAACSSDPVAAPPGPTGATSLVDGTVPARGGTVPPAPTIVDGRAGESLDVGTRTISVSPSGAVRLETVSARAAMVTGGDVLILGSVLEGTSLPDPGGLPDGRHLTVVVEGGSSSGLQGAGMTTYGMVTGIKDRATVKAWVSTRPDDVATLALTNHPISGPVFSGPHQSPFACTTVAFGLGPALDADCSAATKYRWYYVGKDKQVHDLPDPKNVPADVDTTNGPGSPDFIVREEKGVINRSNVVIYVLDPSPSGQPASPWASGRTWGRRLVYRFGGGCGSFFGQGQSRTNAFDLELLRKNYAVTTSSLNTFQTSCNSVLSAETTMMVKEHFVEAYGPPDLTIGDGGSGGAIQQLQIAQNYPGLLDGITPSLPFPDVVTLLPSVTDCGLLDQYWPTAAGRTFTDAQQAAVEGFLATKTCDNWNSAFLGVIDPHDGCDPSLVTKTYDKGVRPNGVRCTFQDSNVNIYGRDPITGFARRPLDNVGVQYGLEALRGNTISMEQFLDLNANVGGYDGDGTRQAQRTKGDVEAIKAAYATGQVAEGGGLVDTPILLRNLYTDALGDIHDWFRAFSLRDRLTGADGVLPPNVVIWTAENTNVDLNAALAGEASLGNEPVFAMDTWLTAARGDGSVRPSLEALTKSRPNQAHDRCVLNGRITYGDRVFDTGPCHDFFVLHGDARTAAGAPRRNDILKCELMPIDVNAYGTPLTDAQAARLGIIFPDGVCDWSKPGVGQVPLTTWPTF
jgi:hypothetical protein